MSDKTEGRFFCTCDRRTVPHVLYGVLSFNERESAVLEHGAFCFDEWREADGVAMEQTGAG